MLHKENSDSLGGIVTLLLVIVSVLMLKIGYINHYHWSPALLITLPLLVIAIVDKQRYKLIRLKQRRQKRNSKDTENK